MYLPKESNGYIYSPEEDRFIFYIFGLSIEYDYKVQIT